MLVRHVQDAYLELVKNNQIIIDELSTVNDSIKEQPNLLKLTDSYKLSSADRELLTKQIFYKKINDLNYGLIRYLSINRMLGQLDKIISFVKETTDRVDDTRLLVSVESAAPLTKEHEDKIQAILHKKIKQRIQIDKKIVNPELIAGFIIKYHNRIIDLSKRNELNQLREKLEKGN